MKNILVFVFLVKNTYNRGFAVTTQNIRIRDAIKLCLNKMEKNIPIEVIVYEPIKVIISEIKVLLLKLLEPQLGQTIAFEDISF